MITATQLSQLTDMLSYCRPHGSVAEGMFIRAYLSALPGLTEDVHGNLHVKVGTSPILWSSHTDTVHHRQGAQTLRVNTQEHTIRLSRRSKRTSNCLGADDTVGVFIMREMILRGIPGHYIFHYGEESGGIGSNALAGKTPHLIGNEILFAIALDRHGTSDVITHQAFGRTASDTFAWSLAKQLPGHYAPTPGIFTDTANYADMIPECTNVSVGYYHEHRSTEYVDYAHVGILLDALCAIDADALVYERDPSVREPEVSHWSCKAFDPAWKSIDTPRSYGNLADDWQEEDWCYHCDLPRRTHTWEEDLDGYCECDAQTTEDDKAFLRYLKGL